uniref:Dynein heavy chain linker domain-containing protein n=1 Tax=Dendroctonus ponderosae TaxID=77166 RepID=A0AAR5P8V1_DENPD
MYEQQLKKYLNIPKNFKGVSDNSEQIYEKIIERNEAVLENVSKQKKELFEQLDAVIKHWQSWLQFEPLDEKKLTSWEHWDLHFRASKTFGQEIAKLPSAEERVGCFLIGLSRMRSDLESHNRSYWDQLVYSLKDSIAEDVVKLQNFIDPSTAALTKQPVSLEEIGESGFNYSSITEAHQESHNRSYWDQLVYSLKDSIAEDVVKLQNFIDPSTAALTKQPVSLEEIGESGFNYSSITEAHQEDIAPALKYVKGEDFSEKHWSDVFAILKIQP